MEPVNDQPQFDDVDELAHVFDDSAREDEWKIRLPRELGLDARERAKHDGITLTELTRRALERDDADEGTDMVRPGRMPKNSNGREQLGDEWKIKLPYELGQRARNKAKRDGISLSSLARRAVTGHRKERKKGECPLFENVRSTPILFVGVSTCADTPTNSLVEFCLLAFLLFANVHRNLNRGTLESEFLTQTALDIAPVTMLEESGGEDDETRRTR